MKAKITILFLIFAFLITTGLGCKTVSKDVERAKRPVKLTYWRVFDEPDTMSDIIQAYRAIHPNVTVEVRKLRPEEYEDALLNALAEDRGPDIFSIHNTWVKKYQSKIAPLPRSYVLPFQRQTGTIKKEIKTELRTVNTLSLRQLKQNFVDVVYDDMVLPVAKQGAPATEKAIYGLPLSLDSLALFYNKDLLNNSGIPEPPKIWKEFQDHIKILTKFDEQGKIIQSGAALGTADNIERNFDILSLLMMQNGAKMTNESGRATFAQMPKELQGASVPPGEGALNFYVNFANPSQKTYTWNNDMPSSLEAFAQGKVAYFFGYSYDIPIIRSLSPKLNFDIAKVPQIEDSPIEINYANYWTETVSRKSKNINWAWDFVQFATSSKQVKKYLDKANKLTALKSLVNSQLEDLDLGYFASQILTAKSWYHGDNPVLAEKAFAKMINSVLLGEVDARQAINLAESKINQTIQ